MGLEILPTDIIPMVNYAWAGRFDNTMINIKAILEGGWHPLNRMLLLHPKVRKNNDNKRCRRGRKKRIIFHYWD
jgi:hypothetical protein